MNQKNKIPPIIKTENEQTNNDLKNPSQLSRKKNPIKMPKLIALVALGLLVGILIFSFFYWDDRTKVTPAKADFILEIRALEFEEEQHGLGAAAEPPLEKRERLKKLFAEHEKNIGKQPIVIGRCWLDGHDSHFISSKGNIHEHLETNENHENKSINKLRKLLHSQDNYSFIFYYPDHYELYDNKGELLEYN